MLSFTQEQAINAVCWSADVDDLDALLVHLNRMPMLRKIKIDRLFVDKNGARFFQVLRENFPLIRVFFDAKYIEIPSKLEELAKIGCSHNPWMLNCMAGSLSNENFNINKSLTLDEIDGLRRFANVCLNAGVQPCAVSVLTTKEDATVKKEFNGRNRMEQVLYYANSVRKAGFTYMVCSPKELPFIRAESQFKDLKLVTPGIRPAGSEHNEQINADTPRSALVAGSNQLVIGRPITEGEPHTNFSNIVADIMSAI